MATLAGDGEDMFGAAVAHREGHRNFQASGHSVSLKSKGPIHREANNIFHQGVSLTGQKKSKGEITIASEVV